MERDLQSLLGGGTEAYGDLSEMFSPYSGLSFQSMLSVTRCEEKSLLPSLDSSYYASDALALGFGSNEVFPHTKGYVVGESSLNRDGSNQKLKSIGSFPESSKLKMPKIEPASRESFNDVISTEPFNFLSKPSDQIPDPYESSFYELPNLRSLEQAPDEVRLAVSSRRSKSFSPAQTDPYLLESVLKNFQPSGCFGPYSEMRQVIRPPPLPAPSAALARQRRQRISDKTRSLQKLLPWDRKMDMATMLEETYKYIKFLRAQISVLQSMPRDSTSLAPHHNAGNINLFGFLTKLNRQQLLQVLVNSPMAQTVMYSQGFCVYSIEQLLSLRNVVERKAVLDHITFNPPTFP